jgi:hypothetical protein
MMYLVTNRLPSSLTIEDIGVRLDGAGGASSSKLLPEQTFMSSRQVREYERKKWITIEQRAPAPVPPKPPIPVWPFSAAPSHPTIPPPAPPVESAMLQSIMAKLDSMAAALQRAPTPQVIYQTASALPGQAAQAVSKPSDEPMFIPKQIVPESAEVKLNVQTSEADTEDFDAGLEALKKARKK